MGRAAVFLDRDGTVIEDVGYLSDPHRVRLLSGVVDGLRLAIEHDVVPVIISNQSGIARGMYGEQELAATDAEMRRQLSAAGVEIGPSYYCVHGPDDHCACRKPLPGLLTRAAEEHDLDLRRSMMVGDRERDVEAGLAAGCAGVAYGFDSRHPGVRRISSLVELFDETAVGASG